MERTFVPLMGQREYLRWIWVPPPPIDEWATRETLTERMEYHRNVFARREAEEKERRLSKVVRESTDAEEVARARADLYERVTLRTEARGGGGFTLAGRLHRIQDGKEEDAASESVASHQVGEEEEETGGEALASSSSP
uniref:Uncharacterized protein n=1 Tax=Oryza sativa subsp. japonica TaxID=39947 RepID=Q6ZIU6_ORYSJ|nr:hypothetical protein [Oryza sativa Japonica Group]